MPVLRRNTDDDHLILYTLAALALWAVGILSEAKASHWGMAALDGVAFPIGIVDGLGSLLGLWR